MKKLDRAARRARANARATNPVKADERPADPLLHQRGSKIADGVAFAVMVGSAVLVHGLILAAFLGVSSVAGAITKQPDENKAIVVSVVEPPPPPPEPPKPEPPPPEPEKAPAPKAEPKRAPPPPDPIDLPKKPPEPPKPEARRIVGLSLESTVEGGGGGPSFAVGNTRMGTTEHVAADAKEAKPLPKEAPTPAPPPPVNRAATRIPSGPGGPTLVKPHRKKPVPPVYPQELRAQGIETDVVVEVTIDEAGKVKSARVLAPSPYAAFNDAALASARAEEFEPALKDGKPIEFTLTFTVRFRLSN